MIPHHIDIGTRHVGPAHPVYVIAEMSANHLGSYERAVTIIEAAADAGADAIKLQTYTPDTMTLDVDNERFRVGAESVWAGEKLHDLYAKAQTPWDWHELLREEAAKHNLQCFSSPFDTSAVDFIEELGFPAYKVASFEILDIPLLRYIAQTGKPVIMSTGMATEQEVDEAVEALRDAGCSELALLKCTSAYPAPPDEMNLRAIKTLAERFGCVVGLSDHSPGHHVAVAAVALGARIVEKHLTQSRNDGGPDAAFSMEPGEFGAMVRAVRMVEDALGTGEIAPAPSEQSHRDLRRSLFVTADIEAGEVFTAENVRSIRPAGGLHPRYLDDILCRHATQDIPKGTPLAWPMVKE